MRPSVRGFTLIELSIVLVIIGLIVGGVLAGQDLIKAARLRAVISEIEKYKTAAMTFEGKYDCLPGDCANVANTIATRVSSPWAYDQNNNVIYNGNGDGLITGPEMANCFVAGYSAGNYGVSEENWSFWQHLAQTGMIAQASLTGASVPNGSQVGVDIPVSALGGSTGYAIDAAYPQADGASWLAGGLYPNVTGNVFILGTQTPDDGAHFNFDVCQLGGPWAPALTTMEAQNLDKKMDDGMPSTGAVTSFMPSAAYNANPNCTSGTSYNVTGPGGPQCTMVFEAGF